MALLAGLQTWSAMDWTANTATAVFPQLIAALQGFIAAVNANPGNANAQLALLKTHAASLSGSKRGFLLEIGGPVEPWCLLWTQPPGDSSTNALTIQLQRKRLWSDNGGNDGYGSFADPFAEPLVDLLPSDWGSRQGAQIVTDGAKGGLFVVQERSEGQEFFLASIHDTKVPITNTMGRTWILLLWRTPASPSWNVQFPVATACGAAWSSNGWLDGLQGDSRRWNGGITLAAPNWVIPKLRSISGNSASVGEDSIRVPLPPRIWQGSSAHYVSGDGRDFNNLGRISQPDGVSRLYQLTKPAVELWVELVDGELEAMGGSWLPWASWSEWRERTHDLDLIRRVIPQSETLLGLTWDWSIGGHYPSYLLSHRLARQWLEAALTSEGNAGGGGEGGSGGGNGGGSRPSRGVMWPRGTPS
jgi:hypothetical protein